MGKIHLRGLTFPQDFMKVAFLLANPDETRYFDLKPLINSLDWNKNVGSGCVVF